MNNIKSKLRKHINNLSSSKIQTVIKLQKVKGGAGNPVIFIDGFLSEEKGCTVDWESQLQDIYPTNPWYTVVWEADSLKAIGKQLGGLAVGRMVFGKAVASVTPIGIPLTAFALLKNPWSKAYKSAKKTGIVLGGIIQDSKEEYILCGHSLGARVIFYALDYLANESAAVVKEVHLLGGAVSNKKENWENKKQVVSGSINNYLSENDKVLSTMYKVGTGFTNQPIGVYPIDIDYVNNVNVSEFVDGHTQYKNNFSKFVAL